jgi:hypothetical protein
MDKIMTGTANNNDNETCPATGFQLVQVCVPVTVKPFARPGATITKCCGEPIIEHENGDKTDKACSGTKNGICSFTITQTLCVEVPVLFGAEAEVGDEYVKCLGASDKSCRNCGDEHED